MSSKTPTSSVTNTFRLFLDGFLALCLLLSIAAFLIGIYFGKTSSEYSVVFLVASGVLVIGIFLTFFLKAENRIKVSLCLFSTLISLFALNLFLRFYTPSPQEIGREAARRLQEAANQDGVQWDTRSTLEVVSDLRNSGLEAYPAGIALSYVNDHGQDASLGLLPLGDISRVSTVLCNGTGPWVTYESDTYGFNNDDAIYHSDGRRILLIGDSYTHGLCVESEDNVAGWLGRLGYKAINLGIVGSSPLTELARLKEYGPHIDPDIVVWLYFGNDLRGTNFEYKFPILRRYMEEDFSQGLVNRQDEIDELLKTYFNEKVGDEIRSRHYESESKNPGTNMRPATATLTGVPLTEDDAQGIQRGDAEKARRETEERSGSIDWRGLASSGKNMVTLFYLRRFVGFDGSQYAPWTKAKDAAAMERFRLILEIARDETDRNGGKLYFVYLPGYENFVSRFPAFGADPQREAVISIVRELEIPLIDFYTVLISYADPLRFFPYRLNGHYTIQGYRLLAEVIAREALEQE